jgi:3',5'-cyclic AMP phosphodiesterase CpdA
LLSAIAVAAGCSRQVVDVVPAHVVVYGDTRSDHATHAAVTEAIMEVEPVAVFHTGDLVNDGNNPDDWAVYDVIASDLIASTDYYPAIGNHENDSQMYFDRFELPNNERWYAVDAAGVHFIVLDSTTDCSVGSEQYNWLKSHLETTAVDREFVASVFHHPPYSTGPHEEDEVGLRQTFVPLFEKYGVDVVFNGHDHTYERTLHNDIYYIVTGGGGAPLYDQERYSPESQVYITTYHFCRLSVVGDQLAVDVFDAGGDRIDGFVTE